MWLHVWRIPCSSGAPIYGLGLTSDSKVFPFQGRKLKEDGFQKWSAMMRMRLGGVVHPYTHELIYARNVDTYIYI